MDRDQQKAMFAKMHGLGIGSRVELTKPFGLGDIPVGSHGTVVGRFGKEPSIKFDHSKGDFVAGAENLKILKAKKRENKENTILANGSTEQLKRELLQGHRFSNGGDNFVGGYVNVYDDGGFEYDIPFSVELSNNRAKIHLAKGDIPRSHKYMSDEIFDEAVELVADAINGRLAP